MRLIQRMNPDSSARIFVMKLQGQSGVLLREKIAEHEQHYLDVIVCTGKHGQDMLRMERTDRLMQQQLVMRIIALSARQSASRHGPVDETFSFCSSLALFFLLSVAIELVY